MALVLLILLVILIILFDKKYYKTIYTPSVILSVPFLIICFMYMFNSKYLGFKSLNYDVLYIWVFGLFFFWLTGIFTNILVPIKLYKLNVEENKVSIYKYSEKVINISFFLAIILTYFLIQSYFIYLSKGGEEVEEYLGKGIQAHLFIILKLLSILSFLSILGKGNKIFKLKNLYIIFISLALSIMYATKSGILILIISYFFAWVLFYNKKIKLWHIITALILGFGVFYLTYSIAFGELAPISFIWRHMLLYYVSGISSMSAYFSMNNSVGIEWEMLYRFPINLINLLSGNSEDVKVGFSNEWTYIGNETTVNVKTFFGTIYLYGGFWIGIFSCCFFSFFCHLFFKMSKGRNSLIFLVLYCYLLAVLCFGWFDFYFNSLVFYESIFIAIIFNFIIINKKI
ncbi:DUF6337 family protein [Chishuiella changwenlii]|uniref:DUF6337 family protein n=1 Tax=Chishuiella changwenlii TaxID=1434701 RepID=UPI002FDB5902